MAPGLMPRKVKYLDSNTTGQVELGCRERTTEKGCELWLRLKSPNVSLKACNSPDGEISFVI